MDAGSIRSSMHWAASHDVPKPYTAGTWGPAAAIALIERDGRTWHDEAACDDRPRPQLFDSREALAAALAKGVARSFRGAMAMKGEARLAVSGGNTPALFLRGAVARSDRLAQGRR